MHQIIVLLLIGLCAGFLSGFLGIGGVIIIVPALVGLLTYSQLTAQGTSLALLLPPLGILAVMNYYKAGSIDIRAAIIMAATFLIGSYFSSKLALSIPVHIVKKSFAIFLFIYSIKLFFSK